MRSYSLVTEKWIPCIKNGQLQEFGLLDVLVRAHEITELYDPSPLVTVALHRLILAILHRNFGPPSLEDWKRLWQAQKWEERRLADYFERWQHRFYLFDEERPFYQVPEMANAHKHPVLHLAMEISSGNNATLFDHSRDELPQPVSPAVASRYVIATQCYAIGGGRSFPFYLQDAPLSRGLSVLLLGENLFQTLMLNMLVYNKDKPLPQIRGEEDLPVWERDILAQPEKSGSLPSGYLDYLTWQSRSIHLFPEKDFSEVRYCQIQQNLTLKEEANSSGIDPFKCYQKQEKRGWMPLRIREDRAVWRDSHALLADSPSSERPRVLSQLAQVRLELGSESIMINPSYRLSVTGLVTEGKAANVILWRHERLPLPQKYLADELLLETLKQSIELAEEIAKSLRKAVYILFRWLTAPGAEQPTREQKKNIDRLAEHLSSERRYWASLGNYFPNFMIELAGDCVRENGEVMRYGHNAKPRWANTACKIAMEAFQAAINGLDRSSRSLKAASKAEVALRAALNGILAKH